MAKATLTHEELFSTLKAMGPGQLEAVLRFRFQFQMVDDAGKDITWVLKATDKEIVERIAPEQGITRDEAWEAIYFYMEQKGIL